MSGRSTASPQLLRRRIGGPIEASAFETVLAIVDGFRPPVPRISRVSRCLA